MKHVQRRSLRTRPHASYDETTPPPDPYGEFPDYVDAVLDGACGNNRHVPLGLRLRRR